MSWPEAFVYDDQPCPVRTLGKHFRNERGNCEFCGRTTYSAKLRIDADGVDPKRCALLTCRSIETKVNYYTLDIGLPDGVLWPDQENTPVRTCLECDILLRKAQRARGVSLRISPEGMVWVDNLDFLRFAA